MDAQDIAVNWFRNDILVLKYPNEEKLEKSHSVKFQKRMELLQHDMAEGKVTLRIQEVQVNDSGRYTCCVQSPDNHDEGHIELLVAAGMANNGNGQEEEFREAAGTIRDNPCLS
ncbi:myelin-oligodendrocyte glycoprotein-like [Notamacropus eugenii]|uniref:myelin-oligodendrocyte glycoprotein-like n=1 Tax=Notamacropus eugenii TaxID=9315 RepID=UPI003B67782B